MDSGTILGLMSFGVALLAAVNSQRKTNIEGQAGANQALQALNKTYKDEIERLEGKLDDAEKHCTAQIQAVQTELNTTKAALASANQTIVAQAGQIAKLQEHTRGTGD